MYKIHLKRRNSWPLDVSALDALNDFTCTLSRTIIKAFVFKNHRIKVRLENKQDKKNRAEDFFFTGYPINIRFYNFFVFWSRMQGKSYKAYSDLLLCMMMYV